MKRLLLLVIGTCVTCLALGLVSAALVEPYGGVPAPGYKADSYACYRTCILPVDVVVGDYNIGGPDGWTDIAVLCSATGQVMYYQNRALLGPGVFLPPPPVAVPALAPMFTAASDLELSDLNADVGNYVLYGTTSPTLGYADRGGLVNFNVNSSVGLPVTTTGILTADLNYDSQLDVILLSKNNPAGVGAGVTPMFSPITNASGFAPSCYTTGDVVAGALADLNGDGWIDVVVITDVGTIEIVYNIPYSNASVLSVIPTIIPAADIGIETLTDIAVGDFNADGLNDLVVVGTNPPNLGIGETQNGFAQVFINRLSSNPATVGFRPAGAEMRTWGFNATAVEVLDADGNGRDDFAVANKGSATVTIFLADALPKLLTDGRATRPNFCLPPEATDEDLIDVGFWLFKYELQCGYFPIALDSADFDWNGKADLVVVLQSATENLHAQDPSCIEIIFDVACGFHSAGNEAPAQRFHTSVPNVYGESQDCEPCGPDDPCSDNTPPNSSIETEGNSGN